MSDNIRHDPHPDVPNRPNLAAPDAQARALGRRQSLDEQQRAFRTTQAPARPKRPN